MLHVLGCGMAWTMQPDKQLTHGCFWGSAEAAGCRGWLAAFVPRHSSAVMVGNELLEISD